MDNIFTPRAQRTQRSLFSDEELGVKHTPELQMGRLCPIREVFPLESDLEEQLLHDMDAHNLISERTGIDVAQVARQVRSTRELAQRMDLVATGLNPTDPNIVIELMLHQLDSDHTLRGIGYAYSNNARHLVFVASAFPQTALNLLNEWNWVLKRKNATVHLLRLETRQGSDGSANYDLIPETPPAAIDRRQTFLEALRPVAHQLGDDSLLNCNVTTGKRLERYVGLHNVASIRIYGGHGNARIAAIARDKSIHQALAQACIKEKLEKTLAPLKPTLVSGTQEAVIASFHFEIDTSTTPAAEDAIQRVARAYTALRREFITQLESLGLPPVLRQPRARFMRPHATSSEVANTLNAVTRPPPNP